MNGVSLNPCATASLCMMIAVVAVADSRNGLADFIRQIEAPSFRAGWTSSFD